MIDAELDPSVPSRTILVVEDEALIRLVVCDVLREFGFRVIEAANADEAFTYVKADPNIDLVFSDVRMPGTMDGVMLSRRLKSEFPHIKVVLASGHLLEGDLGNDTLLFPKPYPVTETVAHLMAVLDGKPSLE